MSSRKDFEGDAGAPLPDFNVGAIDVSTVAPAYGIGRSQQQQPDYLDYDQKGRGVVVTMFANTGMSYLLGIGVGGLVGFREGLVHTPSSRFRVKLNSILNHCGRHGSMYGNTAGVVAIMYSLFEGAADHFELDSYTGPLQPASPAFASFMTGATFYSAAGPRVAALAGTIGLGSVGVTYAAYSVLGLPFGYLGYMFF